MKKSTGREGTGKRKRKLVRDRERGRRVDVRERESEMVRETEERMGG